MSVKTLFPNKVIHSLRYWGFGRQLISEDTIQPLTVIQPGVSKHGCHHFTLPKVQKAAVDYG